MNDEIIHIIEKLAQIASIRGDSYREQAFRNAILSIRKINWSIRTSLDKVKTEKLEGVGKNIRRKLIEYATTGQVSELIALENSSDIIAYRELSKIAGVGPKTIAEWLRKGIVNLVTLRRELAAGSITLTNMQKYGLMFYEDLNSRIPRDEVYVLGSHVCGYVNKLCVVNASNTIQNTVLCEIVGSYRRELSDSGDIDIITTGPYSLRDLAREISHDPNFIDVFSLGAERFTFIYRSPASGKVRQIDVLNLPREQYWPGLLYFTGSWEFNTAMRGTAKSRGYLLNQRGLFRLRVTARGQMQTPIKIQSERDIFDTIGIKYVPPRDRTGSDKIMLV